MKGKNFEINTYLFKSKGISIGFNLSYDRSKNHFYFDIQVDFIKWWFGISIYVHKS